MLSTEAGWIGVDLDGTLARYDGWQGRDHIGDPVPAMMARVRAYLAQGVVIRIFTARVSCPEPERSEAITHIHAWCDRHGLPRLEVTCVKDHAMVRLYDDRCVQVERNTGRLIGS